MENKKMFVRHDQGHCSDNNSKLLLILKSGSAAKKGVRSQSVSVAFLSGHCSLDASDLFPSPTISFPCCGQ